MQGLAREIIYAVGENMSEGLEPLLTKTLAPSLYQVYLHPDDYDRLRSIFDQIEAEARIHLDDLLRDLEKRQGARIDLGALKDAAAGAPGKILHASPLSGVLKKIPSRSKARKEKPPATPSSSPTTPRMKFMPAAGEWHIRFQEDPGHDLEPGEVEVVSELAVGTVVEYGAGNPTERIKISTTRRLGRSETHRQRESETPAHPTTAPAEPAPPDAPPPSAAPVALHAVAPSERPTAPAGEAAEPETQTLAVIDYEEQGEQKSFELKEDCDSVLIGRGALDVWVDLRLRTLADVSRRHSQVRRDAEDRFWIQDLSQYGTWVDGRQVPAEGEIELRDGSVIDLAGVTKLRFRLVRQVPALPVLPPPPPPPAPRGAL